MKTTAELLDEIIVRLEEMKHKQDTPKDELGLNEADGIYLEILQLMMEWKNDLSMTDIQCTHSDLSDQNNEIMQARQFIKTLYTNHDNRMKAISDSGVINLLKAPEISTTVDEDVKFISKPMLIETGEDLSRFVEPFSEAQIYDHKGCNIYGHYVLKTDGTGCLWLTSEKLKPSKNA